MDGGIEESDCCFFALSFIKATVHLKCLGTLWECQHNIGNGVNGVYEFTGLDYWTGLLDWTTGLILKVWFSFVNTILRVDK